MFRSTSLGGTIQNDILKEYVAARDLRLPAETFDADRHRHLLVVCEEHASVEHDLDLGLPHPRGRLDRRPGDRVHDSRTESPTSSAAIAAGLAVDDFAPRLSFFWNAHNNLFEEVAKYRAARRMWARIMTERFGAQDERSKVLRFHTQTGGSTLTAQQPENNIVRVTTQALSAVLGGTQSLHTNGFDEALGLPTTNAAKIALRTQQIIANESGVADTVDPLAGSWFVESLTDSGRVRRLGLPRSRSTRWAAQSRRSRAATCRARSSRPPTPTPRPSTTRRRSSSASTATWTPKSRPAEVFPLDPQLAGGQIERDTKARQSRA